jgi:class III poly(R)-hydroxyalkanoic acid synthase PhaE subunit
MAQVQPFLGSLRGESSAWLNLPAFGLGREQQERVQKLMQAQMDYQQRTSDYNAQLAKAAKGAFERFEQKLAERSEPGRQIESARGLFDVWIDAAEESWAQVAMGAEYRRVYGEMVNAQMRLRLAVQGQIEQVAGQLGLPTRSEVNGSHKKLAALEREVRALRQQLAAFDRAPPPREFDDAANDEEAPRAAPRASPRKPAVKKKAAKKHVLPQVTAPRAAHSSHKPRGKGR